MSILNRIDPKKIVRKVKREVKKVANKARHEAEDCIRTAGHQVENRIEDIAAESIDRIEEAAAEASNFTRKAFSEIEGAILSAAVKDAAQKALAIAKLGPSEVSFEFQAVVGLRLTFSADEVLSSFQEVIDNPPSTEKGLLEFIKAVVPTELIVFAGAELSLGVQISVQAGAIFEKETLIENWCEIIKAFS